jgi:hypothetical protein
MWVTDTQERAELTWHGLNPLWQKGWYGCARLVWPSVFYIVSGEVVKILSVEGGRMVKEWDFEAGFFFLNLKE